MKVAPRSQPDKMNGTAPVVIKMNTYSSKSYSSRVQNKRLMLHLAVYYLDGKACKEPTALAHDCHHLLLHTLAQLATSPIAQS